MTPVGNNRKTGDSGKEDSSWAQAYGPVGDLLKEVDARLRKSESIEALARLVSAFPDKNMLEEAEDYILRAGGKRLRAALCLLSASACGAPPDRAMSLAVGVELFHAATLVLDDLIEDARLRRGKPAVHKMWGDPGALAAAVGLQLRALPSFIESAKLAMTTGDPLGPSRMVGLIGQSAARVVWGEIMQHRMRMNYDLDEQVYMRIIGDKTGALFELCCEGGALIAGQSDGPIGAMKKYGRHMGLAFQISDDVLDLEGEEKRLGKTPGSDLNEGRVTLPLIYYFRDANDRQLEYMARLLPPLRKPPIPTGEIVEELERAGSLKRCRKVSRSESARARRALSRIPESEATESLRVLADLAARRSR